MARRRRRSVHPLLIVLAVVVILPLAAFTATVVLVNPNSFKPRIVAAVEAATGRQFRIDGDLSIGFSLTPTLQANGVHLANPPGASRPDMATLEQVRATLALLPLLRGRLEIGQLELTQPDLLVETDAAGRSNWNFKPVVGQGGPPASGAAPAPAQTSVADNADKPTFAIASVLIHAGRLSWHDMQSGHSGVAAIKQLVATSAGPMAPMSATADLEIGGQNVAMTAETGPLGQLLSGEPITPPWPMQIVARVAGARFAASGSLERPIDGRGYQLTLDAAVPDLGPVGTFLGQALPSLRDISASAKVSDAPGGPFVTGIVVRAGGADLRDMVPGLQLDSLAVDAPALDQPITVTLAGGFAGTPLKVSASLGAPSLLIPGTAPNGQPTAAYPVDVTVQVAGGTISAKGGITAPATLSGLNVAVSARVPDLGALSPLVGTRLPAMHDVTFDGNLTDAAGGFSHGFVLQGMTLAASSADLAGDVTVGLQPRPSVQAQLTSKRIDIDGLQAEYTARPELPAPTPPAASPPQQGQAGVVTPAVAKPSYDTRFLISDRPFSLATLNEADGDVKLAVGEIHSSGAVYKDVAAHVVADHGKLSIEPLTATLPGGHLDMHLAFDASAAEAAPLTFTIAAPGVALKPLLTAFELPDDVTGIVELDADVTANGRSAHALAASLSGKVGLIMTDGVLDNRLLSGLLSSSARVAKVPADVVIGGGQTKLRCGAIRLDASNGVATVGTLVLDTQRALVQGAGVVNLRDEALALRVRPLLRVGGPGLVVPLRITGAFRSPDVVVDTGGALQGAAIGILSGVTGTLGSLARNPMATLNNFLVGERGGDACGPAIASARAAKPALK